MHRPEEAGADSADLIFSMQPVWYVPSWWTSFGLRATEPDFTRKTSARCSAGGRIEIEACGRRERIEVIVRDSGQGIPCEEIPKMCDRLYRGDKSRSQRGLGLGLSLVRAVVHAHKGSAEVFSEPGQGSLFIVHLPLDSDTRR